MTKFLKVLVIFLITFSCVSQLSAEGDHFGIEDYRNRHGIQNTKGNKVISHLGYIDWLLLDENKNKWKDNDKLKDEVKDGFGIVLLSAGLNVDPEELKFRADHPKKIDDPNNYFSPHQKKVMHIMDILFFDHISDTDDYNKDYNKLFNSSAKKYAQYLKGAFDKQNLLEKRFQEKGITREQRENHWRNIFWAPYIRLCEKRTDELIGTLIKSKNAPPFKDIVLFQSESFNPIPAATLLLNAENFKEFTDEWTNALQSYNVVKQKSEEFYKSLSEKLNTLSFDKVSPEMKKIIIGNGWNHILRKNLNEAELLKQMSRLNTIYKKFISLNKAESLEINLVDRLTKYFSLFNMGCLENYMAFLESMNPFINAGKDRLILFVRLEDMVFKKLGHIKSENKGHINELLSKYVKKINELSKTKKIDWDDIEGIIVSAEWNDTFDF